MTDAELIAAIEAWRQQSVDVLKAAKGGDDLAVRLAVLKVCEAARMSGMGVMETWDYLMVSYPGQFDLAGFSDAEIEAFDSVIQRAWADAFELP